MRASRLLSIQMLLQTRGRMTAQALSEALEVSERTLYRDIDELTAAGVPVYAERGRSGGFQLLPGWKTTLTGLTPAEAEAVFLSGLAGPARELGLGGDVERAQLKLLAALPEQWRERARRLSSRLHLDPVDWYREADDLPQLQAVSAAVLEERPLEMVYESWTRTVRQVVHPLGLVLKSGTWYLVAGREQKVRTFRVAAIVEPRVLEGRAWRPRRFDLAEHWRDAVRRFERELHTGQAEVAATARGLAALRALGAAQARALRGTPLPAEDTRVRVRVPTESPEQAAGQLLRLADEVEVLGPPRLLEAIRQRLARACAVYGVPA
ncbi:MAG TPA: WYL domain-containing protein [Ramlibacter sp.]|jgi:predicted DNA-binding transcriptional regulator YafY|uniref:helix-turn-helix transcriptional regulator n=1 Tax=Ramlibacter sp. TaxID=1917967 RepID=UPI002D2A8033|nr:WYL domain-containing protein [Ramlibacter sp.]HZY17280.1 WYL domain-containing protein [Ramlibacter sp.]